ncbi:BgTH12-07854, partial [Blumeria graminis f. sp. triticale]
SGKTGDVEHLCNWAYTENISTLDGVVGPIDGPLEIEPAMINIRDALLIHHVAWTQRSKESSSPTRLILVHVPEANVHKFLPRIQLFGQAIGVNKSIKQDS